MRSRTLQHGRLAGTGTPAHENEPSFADAFQNVEAMAAQRLEPASDARLVGSGVGEPGLCDLGSEPPAGAVDRRVRVRFDKGAPLRDPGTLHIATDKAASELDRCLPSTALVRRADGGPVPRR